MTRTSKTIAATTAHPPSFVCPLTFEMMEDPVMDKCAHSFERSAIVEWIARGNEFCPISRKQLSVDDLVPNHVLAERIEKWQWQQSQMETWKDKEQETTHVDDETSMDDTSHHDSITRTPSEDDIELGRQRRHGRILRKQKYEQVPSQFMLLPQEREVLQIVRARAEENRLKRRRRMIQMSLLVSLFIIVVFVLGLGMARYYVSNNRSEEGPDELTRRQDVDGIVIEDINDDAIIDV